MTSYTPTNLQSFYNHPDQYSTKGRSKGGSLETNFDKDDAIVNDIIEKIGLFIDVADIAALRALRDNSTYVTSTTQHVLRADQFRKVLSASDGTNTFLAIYWWSAASAASDADGATGNVDTDGIVQPLAGYTAAGRWIRIAQINTTGAGVFVSRQGIEALRTMLDYLYINMANAAADIFLKLAKRTAGSVLKVASDAKIQLRNAADSAFQDFDANLITASSQMVQTGTPSASAVLALFQQGSAPVGASANGNYRSINTAGGFTGYLDVLQVNGVIKFLIDYLGNVTAAGNFIGAGNNNQFHANPQASATKSLISLVADIVAGDADGNGIGANFVNGYAGDFFNFQVNGSTLLRAFADGRVKGTAATNNDEFVTKAQATSIATQSIKWGTGADGAASLSGTVTLTEDKHYTTVSIADSSTINMNGFNIYHTGALTCGNNVTFAAGTGTAGEAGGTDSAPMSPGEGGRNTTGSNPHLNGSSGCGGMANTGIGMIPHPTPPCVVPTSGVAGAAGGQGENPGSILQNLSGGNVAKVRILDYITALCSLRAGLFANGAAAGGGSGNGSAGVGGGGGGGGAAAPTSAIIGSSQTYGTGVTFTGVGGAGGAGATSGNGDGGGGGGGSGALFVLIYETITKAGAFSATLTGGAGGAAGGAGAAAGTAGTAGYVLEIDVG